MKILKHTIRAIIILMTLCIFAQGSFAYAPETTHAGLTQEMLKFYEIEKGDVFSGRATELVVQGSVDEDYPDTRCLNHFYDPVHGIGFNKNRPSIDWATDEFTENEFTWNRGIEAYAEGDEEKAMVTLGHILHLLEDASVPDHTRNDPHKGDGMGGLYTGESPFEHWTDIHKDRRTLRGFAEQLAEAGVRPNACGSFRGCFSDMAWYSNGNFFSRDTIGSTDYQMPKLAFADQDYGYTTDGLSGNLEKLYRIIKKADGTRGAALVADDDYSVISDYFDRLAPQAVGVGARVIDLYMIEAKFARAELLAKQKAEQERAVSEQVALSSRLQGSGFFGQLAFGLSDLFYHRPVTAVSDAGSRIASAGYQGFHGYMVVFGNAVYTTSMVAESGSRVGGIAYVNTKEFTVKKTEEGVQLAKQTGSAINSGLNEVITEAERIADLVRQLTEARRILLALASASQAQPMSSGKGGAFASGGEVLGASVMLAGPIFAGFSGGGVTENAVSGTQASTTDTTETETSTSTATSTPEEIPDETASTTSTSTPDTTPPDRPVVTLFQGVSFPGLGVTLEAGTTSIHFTGTGEASGTVTLLVPDGGTTTAFFYDTGDDLGWSFDLVLPEGIHTLYFGVTDLQGNTSSTTEVQVLIELPLECTHVSGPLVGNITWTTTESPYCVDGLSVEGGSSLTVDPGVVIKIGPGAWWNVPGTLTVGAPDGEEVIITSFSDDTVGGVFPDGSPKYDTNGDGTTTTPLPGDWRALNLNGGTLTMHNTTVRYGGGSDIHGQLYLQLGSSATVASSTFTESAYRHIAEDGGALTITNSILAHGATGIDIRGGEAEVSTNSFSNLDTGITLAGGHLILSGNQFTNMATYAGELALSSLENHGGNVSTSSFLFTGNVSGIKTLPPDGPSYLFPQFTVNAGSSLTILPGVIVKMPLDAWINVTGTLVAGVAGDLPVIFTSMKDDAVGGDTNGDGTETTPAVGDWKGFNVNGGALSLTNAIVRYGGGDGSLYGQLFNQGGTITLDQTQVTESAGLNLYNWFGTFVATSSEFSFGNNGGIWNDANGSLAGSIIMNGSSIHSNTPFGVQNTSGLTIDMSGNWWGDPSGPFHGTTNPDGLGNSVSSSVNFADWLTASPL